MASTPSLLPFSMQGTGDTSDHFQHFWAQHSKPQKTGMNRAQYLKTASTFIILPRHRTLAMHWLVLSSLEATHMLESTPSWRWWIAKHSNTQMFLHWNPAEEQWPRISLLESYIGLSSPEMLHNLHCEHDINIASPGSQPGLNCGNWLSINILPLMCPLVALLGDRCSPIWVSGFMGSGNHSQFVMFGVFCYHLHCRCHL